MQRKQSIGRKSLHEEVAEHVRRMIVSGTLEPGEKISFSRLAEELEVSLTPLREALKVLSGEGLVELTPNRGAKVTPITIEDTTKLFEVIAGIESLAAELATIRINEKEFRKLEKLHKSMRTHFEKENIPSYFEKNSQIHDLLVECSKNEILVQTRLQLAKRAERARFLALNTGIHRKLAMQDHEDMMQALKEKNPEKVRKIWRRHLLSSGAETCRILQESQMALTA